MSRIWVNTHFHCAVIDGVFAPGPDDTAQFFEADITTEDILDLTTKIRKRTLAYMVRHGLMDSSDTDDMLTWDHNGGFSLDASVLIPDWDRAGLERLLRYCARPPVASTYARSRSQIRDLLRLSPTDLQSRAFGP